MDWATRGAGHKGINSGMALAQVTRDCVRAMCYVLPLWATNGEH